ncbi:hypothetical protein OAW18_06720 [Alphaproteobacteria bacterium]|nr:hypothetical protein [Alphaproteobacteria bacterium]
MIDAVKMDVEEQSGHLAESEVARLLTVLQNAEFKRSETRNITKDHSFKPRSLMEIAIEAQQRDAEIEAVKQAEEVLAAAQRAAAAPASKAQAGENQNLDGANFADSDLANPALDRQGTALGEDDDRALMPADGAEDARRQTASPDSPPSPINDAVPNVAPDMTQDIGSGNQASEASGNLANDAPANDAPANDALANDALANDALANDAVEHDSTADNGDGDAAEGTPLAANFETVTAAFERGKAEGMIAGRDAGIAETKAAAKAAAQANLTDKIATFEAALVALAKPQALQAEDLSRSIHAAILKLASQRAGQQIDDMPENFLVRIEALVTSIGQNMAAGKVHINADDYKVMLPYLADTQFDFVAEPGLARGDVILKFAGVELHDIAEARLGGQYAETAKTLAKAPADLAPGITPDETTPTEPASTEPAPVETAPVETASVEGVAASDSAASKNDQDEQPPSPPDETSS